MNYEEFRVEISAAGRGKYRVRVGSARDLSEGHQVTVPRGADANQIVGEWLDAHGPLSDGPTRESVLLRLKDVGRCLYETLFKRSSRSFEDRHLVIKTLQGCQANVGLRLRILQGSVREDKAAATSAALPAASVSWELLWFPPEADFLATREHVSIVRTLGAFSEPQRVEIHGNPRLLVVSANPSGVGIDRLDRTEVDEIFAALEKREDFWIETLENASFGKTCDALADQDFHILHFHGHGGYSKELGGWHLSFEKDGEEQRISADQFALGLSRSPSLRLVVLSACRSGQLPMSSRSTPLAGVAAALSARGIPAVVAMQAPLTQDAGIRFTKAFYDALRQGESIETAVASGRMALSLDSPEWATPVLYLGCEHSDLFALNPVAPPKREAQADGESPLRLGIRTLARSEEFPHLQQWALDLESRSNRLLALEEFFEGRFIRDPAEWRSSVLPRLERFLRRAKNERRPLELEIVAHPTVAFAAGYELDVKSGVPITAIQQTPNGEQPWSMEDGPIPARPLWDFETTPRSTKTSHDVAVVVEVSRTARKDVEAFLDRQGIEVASLVAATIAGGPTNAKVLGGAHACALARDLVDWLRQNLGPDHTRLHFFFAAPNSLVFFLGQLARVLGPVRLYEHDFERTRHGSYEASLDLP